MNTIRPKRCFRRCQFVSKAPHITLCHVKLHSRSRASMPDVPRQLSYHQLQVPEPFLKTATFFPQIPPATKTSLQRLYSTTIALNYVKLTQKILFDVFYILYPVWTCVEAYVAFSALCQAFHVFKPAAPPPLSNLVAKVATSHSTTCNISEVGTRSWKLKLWSRKILATRDS